MTLPCSDAKTQSKGDTREKEREREKKIHRENGGKRFESWKSRIYFYLDEKLPVRNCDIKLRRADRKYKLFCYFYGWRIF